MEDFNENDVKLILDAVDSQLASIKEDSFNSLYEERKIEILRNIEAYIKLRDKLYRRFA